MSIGIVGRKTRFPRRQITHVFPRNRFHTETERNGIDSKLLEGRGRQGKEASVKLGPGPLFEGFGPLRRQKGVQQQAKEARTS